MFQVVVEGAGVFLVRIHEMHELRGDAPPPFEQHFLVSGCGSEPTHLQEFLKSVFKLKIVLRKPCGLSFCVTDVD